MPPGGSDQRQVLKQDKEIDWYSDLLSKAAATSRMSSYSVWMCACTHVTNDGISQMLFNKRAPFLGLLVTLQCPMHWRCTQGGAVSQHRCPPVLGVHLLHVEEPCHPGVYINMLRLWSVHAQRARMRGTPDPFVRNTRCRVQVSSGSAVMTYKTRVSTCG